MPKRVERRDPAVYQSDEIRKALRGGWRDFFDSDGDAAEAYEAFRDDVLAEMRRLPMSHGAPSIVLGFERDPAVIAEALQREAARIDRRRRIMALIDGAPG